jgi:hypothetical protein
MAIETLAQLLRVKSSSDINGCGGGTCAQPLLYRKRGFVPVLQGLMAIG